MTKAIWKWTLAVTNRQEVSMPAGAEILCVQTQGGMPQLWAICDPEKAKTKRLINVIGTGHPITRDPGRYIGTFQIHSGSLVFHVFEDDA